MDFFPMLNAGLYFLTATAMVVAGMFFFEVLTPKFKAWDEIAKGNRAVAVSFGGKVIALGIIMQSAIANNGNLVQVVLWGAVGSVMLLLGYYFFEWLTPKLAVEDELVKGNVAVGLLSGAFSLAIGLILAASIS